MNNGMRKDTARALAEALFRKDDERALSRKSIDTAQTEQAEKTARLRALRLAKQEAERTRAGQPRS